MTQPGPCVRCGAEKHGVPPHQKLCITCYGNCRDCGGPSTRPRCRDCARALSAAQPCSGCQGPKGESSHISYCRACANHAAKKWAKANPEKVAARNRRQQLKEYGLTPESFAAMSAAQSGRCAICDTDELRGQSLHVDHDHATGRVRALLCGPCNVGLGCARDSVTLLERMVSYLRTHAAHAEG